MPVDVKYRTSALAIGAAMGKRAMTTATSVKLSRSRKSLAVQAGRIRTPSMLLGPATRPFSLAPSRWPGSSSSCVSRRA